MKRIRNILWLFLTLTSVTTLVGQDSTAVKTEVSSSEGVSVGLLHGFCFTRFNNVQYAKNTANRTTELSVRSPRFTLNFGAFVDLTIFKGFSISLEPQYIYMGSHLTEEKVLFHDLGTHSVTDYYSYYFDYFKLPVVANIYPVDKMVFQVGGYYSALLSAEKAYPWVYNSPPREILKTANPSDYGMVFGLGFNTKLAKILFKYNVGMANVLDGEDAPFKHRVTEVVVNWKIYSSNR